MKRKAAEVMYVAAKKQRYGVPVASNSYAPYVLGAAGLYYGGKYLYNKYKSATRPKAHLRPIKVRRARTVKQVKKKLQRLETRVREGETTYEYRYMGARALGKGNKTVARESTVGNLLGNLTPILTALPFYNESTGDFDPKNVISGTDSKRVTIDKVTTTVESKNNFQVPCKLKVYLVTPKRNTNTTPVQDLDSGIASVVTDPATMLPADALIQFSDSPIFKQNWTVKKIKDVTLQPGQTCTVSKTVTDITYNPIAVGTEAAQRQLKSFYFMFVLDNSPDLIGHNSAGTARGYMQCALDQIVKQTTICKYDGGVNAHRLYINNTTGDIGAGGLTGVRPVSDNQAYTHT